jgi:hypothetical protein
MLAPADNKKIEVLVSWIVRECRQGVSDGLLSSGPRYLDPASIRSEVAAFNNSFTVGQPNLWAALMKLVCDCLIFMFVLGRCVLVSLRACVCVCACARTCACVCACACVRAHLCHS